MSAAALPAAAALNERYLLDYPVEAARLLEMGNAAWGPGDREGAVRLWGRAEQTGPGSPAALRARAQINAYNAGGNSFQGL